MKLGMIIVFAILLLSMNIGQIYQEENIPVENATQHFNWNLTFEYSNETTSDAILLNIINKVVDTGGYILFEVGKWGIGFGYDNPSYNFYFMYKILLWITIIGLIAFVIPTLAPVCALIYLCYIGIKKLFKKLTEDKQ